MKKPPSKMPDRNDRHQQGNVCARNRQFDPPENEMLLQREVWVDHTLDDVVESWKKGWRELAKLHHGELRSTYWGPKDNSDLDRIQAAFFEILSAMECEQSIFLPRLKDVLMLVAQGLWSPEKDWSRITFGSQIDHSMLWVYFTVSSSQRREAFRKLTESFAAASTLQEALLELTTQENLDYVLNWLGARVPQTGQTDTPDIPSMQMFSSFMIEPHWQQAMKWLARGLANESEVEEALWNCVWAIMSPKVNKLLEIQKRLTRDMPLEPEQTVLLNELLRIDRLYLEELRGDRGERSFRLRVEPHRIAEDRSSLIWTYTPTLTAAGNQILTPPAVHFAIEIQAQWAKPRFIWRCRAPSCRKLFWTGREHATSCPGSQGNKKNQCALEWIRYGRHLKKIGRNPEKDWSDPKLQEQFLSSRTP